MPLTLGAHHVLAASGQFAIAQPVGLVVSVASIPSYVARGPGTPTHYYRMGYLNLGHALGWQPPIDLVHVPQLVYPLATEFTILRVNLLAGETATVDELVAAPVVNSALQPWDRGASVWSQSLILSISGGTAAAIAWTYTVPAGKILMLSHFDLVTSRYAVATTSAAITLYGQVNGVVVAAIDVRQNVLGANARGGLAAGPLYLPAGSIVAVQYANFDVGGAVQTYSMAAGTLFNV